MTHYPRLTQYQLDVMHDLLTLGGGSTLHIPRDSACNTELDRLAALGLVVNVSSDASPQYPRATYRSFNATERGELMFTQHEQSLVQ